MSTTPTKPGRIELESTITDAEGDMLLLSLAVAEIEEQASIGRAGRKDRECREILMTLDEDDLTALRHASNRLSDSLKALSATFHEMGRS